MSRKVDAEGKEGSKPTSNLAAGKREKKERYLKPPWECLQS